MNLTDYLRKIAVAQGGLLKCTLILPNGDEIPCRDDDQAQLLTSLSTRSAYSMRSLIAVSRSPTHMCSGKTAYARSL
jgi:hypothetical protein